MRAAQLPRVVEGSEPAGSVRAAIATELGLPPGIPVAAGAGDAAAGAIGIGAIADGDAFVSLGTSAQYFVTTAAYRPSRSSCSRPTATACRSAGTSARRC